MRLLLVEWVDSHSKRGWNALDEVAEDCKTLPCRSVGWEVARRNGCIMLASSVSGGGNVREFVSGDICIPMKCVVRIKVLSGVK